jgi:glycosyltransferase involved in cell wall biosynthesis
LEHFVPTTLISHSAATGLGHMGSDLISHIPEIDSVVLIDFPDNFNKADFPHSKILDRALVSDARNLKRCLTKLSGEPGRKFLYIERSRGLSRYTPRSQNIFIPMWEQEPTLWEARRSEKIISVTKHTQYYLLQKKIKSDYLPWPITPQEIIFPNSDNLRILHNAGGFGVDYRKGTPEAIQIFQQSGISNIGATLTITSWKEPSQYIQDLIALNPRGINLDFGFKESLNDLYKGYNLLLYPSRVEGHALPLLEAYARGIPALITNAPPINEYEIDPRFLLPVKGFKGNRAIIDVEQSAGKLRNISLEALRTNSNVVSNLITDNLTWQTLAKNYSVIFE